MAVCLAECLQVPRGTKDLLQAVAAAAAERIAHGMQLLRVEDPEEEDDDDSGSSDSDDDEQIDTAGEEVRVAFRVPLTKPLASMPPLDGR